MESFSLFELNEYIKRVLALNFQEPVWIHAEISQISESRGHYYLELVEKSKSGDQIIAQSSALIWYKSVLFLQKKLQDLLPSLLQPGIEVRLKLTVDFHERYGLKLNILDIDPNYTLGQLEIHRQEILKKLKKEKLLDRNKETVLNPVLQRIAVISSSRAAGYQDFITQLDNNPYGFVFHRELYETSVQGRNVSPEITSALQLIQKRKHDFDCIVIIRGGGSKLDLSAFDDYEIGKHIAISPLPVLTGIGHEIDQSIADSCAHSVLKTPTAVANFLIDHNLDFETNLLFMAERIRELTRKNMETQSLYLGNLEGHIQNMALHQLHTFSLKIDHLEQTIRESAANGLKNLRRQLTSIEELIELSDPARTIRKGYALIRKDKKLISNFSRIKKNDHLEIEVHEHQIDATVDQIQKT